MTVCDRCKRANVLGNTDNPCGPIRTATITMTCNLAKYGGELKWTLCDECMKQLSTDVKEMANVFQEDCQSFELAPAIRKNAEIDDFPSKFRHSPELENKLKSIVAKLETDMQCICGILEVPQRQTGHSAVCPIHQESKKLFREWLQRGKKDA